MKDTYTSYKNYFFKFEGYNVAVSATAHCNDVSHIL